MRLILCGKRAWADRWNSMTAVERITFHAYGSNGLSRSGKNPIYLYCEELPEGVEVPVAEIADRERA